MTEQIKVYAAMFRSEDANGANPSERVEYFCDKDIEAQFKGASPEEYAIDFLLEEGEWLDDVIDEDPITDPVDVIGILENVLEYIRTYPQDGSDDLRQQVEKLLVSYVATST